MRRASYSSGSGCHPCLAGANDKSESHGPEACGGQSAGPGFRGYEHSYLVEKNTGVWGKE